MRIIAGSARGRPLTTPAGLSTRPTSDRTRQALFNSLGSVAGLSFLDLYAGSGAIALEALSRGAARATAVESDRAALAAIRTNAANLGMAPVVVAAAVERFLAGPSEEFDVVFLDPPYALDVTDVLTAAAPWAGDRLVLERATRDGEPPWPPAFGTAKSRKYGETTLWYGARR